MKLHCPHCGVNGSADDSYHGKNVKCPKCNRIFLALVVEREEHSAEVPTPPMPVDEQIAAELVAAELPTDLREEEEVPDESEILADEEALSDEIPAGETDRPPEETAVVDEAVREPEVEREEVLDWSDIVSEIDAQEADEDNRDKKEREEAQADLDRLFAEASGEDLDRSMGEKPESAEAETEIAEAVADDSGENERLPGIDELPEVPPPAMNDQPEPPAASVKSDKNLEDSFIFEDDGSDSETVREVERQPYGLDKEQCWQCGKEDRVGVPFIAKDGRLYCPDCVPAEELEAAREEQVFAEMNGSPLPAAGTASPDGSTSGPKYRFTIGGMFREAWEKTKGGKGPIWAGSAVMYLAVLILVAGTAFLLPMNDSGYPADTGTVGAVGDLLLQALINAVSVVFTAGLMFMGVRKVAGDSISWRMVFTGFSVAGKIIVAAILQTILIMVGLLLLVLPGIYLAIGYAMTMPLIVDRNMSPWQAMEASRKAIHKVWWKVAGLFFATGLLMVIAAAPFGIGLIWMWPLSFVLAGVVYRHLFGVEKKVG